MAVRGRSTGLLFAILGLTLLCFGIVALVAGAHEGWIYGHFAGGAGLLVYAAATSLQEFREIFGRDATRRGAKRGGNVAAQTGLLAVILGLLAYLSARHPVHWDWTEAAVHSLAGATRETLEQIPEERPVEVLAFFERGSEGGAKEILERYAYESDRLRFRFVDPNRDPNLAARHEIRSNGVLIVCGGECESATGTARLTEPTEQEITRAIRNVISERKTVYFLTGHGEASPDDAEARGFSRAREALGAENLDVKTLLLAREPEVPHDAAALIVAGAERPLQPRELEGLDRYLRGGGSLLVLLDPFVRTNLVEQLRSWGVEVGDDVIVDQQIQLFAGPQLGVQPIVVTYGSHPITREMGGSPTLFHLARSLRKADGAEDSDVVELASTSPASWAETDTALFLDRSMVAKDGSDRPGPVPLAVARTFEAPKAEKERHGSDARGRLVVVGDSDFGRNRYIAEFYNQDFLINAVNWLSGEEAFITIDRNLPRASLVRLTPEEFRRFRYLSLFVLPEGILFWGILLWWRRRA
jgi:ABC-type uncharacterized transport system involved in gliding motility auxiliary subunit